MKLKITPEMAASMRETKAELASAMSDASFKAEFNGLQAKYLAREMIAKLFARSAGARKLASTRERQNVTFKISFGAGLPAQVSEGTLAFA